MYIDKILCSIMKPMTYHSFRHSAGRSDNTLQKYKPIFTKLAFTAFRSKNSFPEHSIKKSLVNYKPAEINTCDFHM
uniref:Uncharacterized protein n=1 Tax=Candidatus Kentrum sp. MB TaxID=2138164 RepID=A0A450XDM5_9GAMM|nr:MAG: hypothetical protein BECKMB1821G_GA0114241_102731 [Candidatus Kentron sp. MB]